MHRRSAWIPSQALHVNTEMVPAWRQAIRVSDAVGAAVVILVALVLAIRWRRCRWIAGAAGLAAVVYLAAEMPLTWPVLKALGTWLIPAGAMAWFVYRLWRKEPGLVPAVAVAVICLVLCTGCSGLGAGSQSMARSSMIERVECSLSAGTDSMELKYHLRISASQPARFPILPGSTVLISTTPLPAHVSLQTEDGMHVVHVDRPGHYDVEATFLAALPPAGEDQQRRFELALPLALTNRVSLVIPDANVLVEVPQAVSLTSAQQEGRTRVEAMFTPGQPAVFTWRPLERQAAQEEVRFYAQDMALASVTPGAAAGVPRRPSADRPGPGGQARRWTSPRARP